MPGYRNSFWCLLIIVSISCDQQGDGADTYLHGGLIRTDTTLKQIHLVFTGHEFADGADVIINTLKKHGVKATFFFTGDFYRNPAFEEIIKELKANGHYLGAHSDKHLLYCSWEKRDSLLVSREEFLSDLVANYDEMKRFGIDKSDAPYFMPPYEWYNDSISIWTKAWGLQLINFTSGTLSHTDWTYPELGSQYRSGEKIMDSIYRYEAKNGLNGFILLTHIGTDSRRTDKLYHRLNELIEYLSGNGYVFTLIPV